MKDTSISLYWYFIRWFTTLIPPFLICIIIQISKKLCLNKTAFLLYILASFYNSLGFIFLRKINIIAERRWWLCNLWTHQILSLVGGISFKISLPLLLTFSLILFSSCYIEVMWKEKLKNKSYNIWICLCHCLSSMPCAK